MAIDDLPLPVVNFLNVIGVPWPYINEDTVLEFASLVRQFGQAVEKTHQEASQHIAGVAAAYRSEASAKMTDGWAKLSERHVTEIVIGCDVLAVALDAAAAYIVVQKGIAIAELIGMASAFVADQAAAVATFGIAEAALPVIIDGAEKLVQSLEMDLQQYLVSKVAEAALKPLMAKVEQAVSGLDWSQSGAVAQKGTSLAMQSTIALDHAAGLDKIATQFRQHATTFASGIRGLHF